MSTTKSLVCGGPKAACSLQFEGNRIHFEFYTQLLDCLDLAISNLFEGNLHVEDVQEHLQKSDLDKRIKLIRFADKSPAGWTAVEEYESDELALIFGSPFVPPNKSSLLTSALTAISEDTGLIRQSALSPIGQEAVSATLAPVQRPQSQLPSDLANVLARLDPDKYSYFDFDFDHFSLDSSSADYFEGSSQVIVKVKLRAYIIFRFGKALVHPSLF